MDKIYVELTYRDGNGGVFGPAWVENRRQAERFVKALLQLNAHRGPVSRFHWDAIPSTQAKVMSNDWMEMREKAFKAARE